MVMIYQLLTVAGFGFLCYRLRRSIFRGMRKLHSASGLRLVNLIAVCVLIAFITQPAQALLDDTLVGDFLTDLGGSLLDSVVGAVADVFQGVYNAMMQLFGDLICLIVGFFGQLLLDAFDAIPLNLVEAAATITGYLKIANHWAPIAEGAAMFAGYLAFLAVQLPLKLVIKLFIPTVG